MLFLSQFPIKTGKTAPKGSDNISTSFLLQAGYIRQEMAGAYSYLPMWLKVLRKIEQIVREEMNAIGAQEVLMPSLGSKEHWQQTGRWDTVDVLFRLPAAEGKEYALNPTHEEVVTPLAKEFIQSYKDLNFWLYQIQSKFRNEKRAKSGILRGREFIMKDLYSFHTTEAQLLEYYDNVRIAYKKVYDRLWIGKDTYETVASGGDFTTLNSHEYQTVLPIGEDTIYIDRETRIAYNEEVMDLSQDNLEEKYEITMASEVGNIFPLMTKFSDAFDVGYTDENGKKQTVLMGCYGIGISRLMGVIAEYFCDKNGLVWPEHLAPATHYIIPFEWYEDKAKELAGKLESEGKECIVDDRAGVGFGQKARDAELLGIPYRVVISAKTLEAGGYEWKERISADVEVRK